jgi:hypothetical protein
MNNRPAEDMQRIECAKILLGIWNSHFWDSAKLLAQAWAFYVAIMAALVGYVMSNDLPLPLSKALIIVAAIISVIHLVGSCIWAWGLSRVVVTLEALTRELNEKAFRDLKLVTIFSRWRSLQTVMVFNSALVAIVMLVGLVLLFNNPGILKPNP